MEKRCRRIELYRILIHWNQISSQNLAASESLLPVLTNIIQVFYDIHYRCFIRAWEIMEPRVIRYVAELQNMTEERRALWKVRGCLLLTSDIICYVLYYIA